MSACSDKANSTMVSDTKEFQTPWSVSNCTAKV